MNITIKRASECTFEQLTQVWNEGFSDYYSQMTFTVEMFTNRFATDELMPTRSVVAFIEDKPVGIILTGYRTVNGRKVAWNGGTCVIPEYRRYGVGKVMMDAILAMYEKEGVELATLEAYKQNERAIALYEQKGYKIVDYLLFLEMSDALNPISMDTNHSYQVQFGVAMDAGRLPFYNHDVPWQSHCNNLRFGGETLMVMDNGVPVGYILFRRMYDEHGKVKDIRVYSYHVDPNRQDKEAIMRYGLHQLFKSEHPIAKIVFVNTPASQSWFVEMLQAAGFTIRIEQVFMIRESHANN